jgi:hypothetical protein
MKLGDVRQGLPRRHCVKPANVLALNDEIDDDIALPAIQLLDGVEEQLAIQLIARKSANYGPAMFGSYRKLADVEACCHVR